MENQTNYPIETTEGFSFLNEEDEFLHIETKSYENNSLVKRIKLSSGKTAIVRELKGSESDNAVKVLGKNFQASDVNMAIAAAATKIDDNAVLFEDLKELKAKDWNKIKIANAELNF